MVAIFLLPVKSVQVGPTKYAPGCSGHPARKRVRRATRELQERLQNLCVARRDGSKSVAEALRGLGHTIRFV